MEWCRLEFNHGEWRSQCMKQRSSGTSCQEGPERRIHGSVETKGTPRTIFSLDENALVDMYAMCGCLTTEAEARETTSMNVVSSLLTCYELELKAISFAIFC
ncbi:hypothetical protein HAX54_053513 [Datura stramonium]|uniref:Uncharacterized protein n=1 Tax=Datura stramonium TaxID=4076 RepID=A0ABS8T0I3_DATST|nr:hypothetical protein [Datura stramonium]